MEGTRNKVPKDTLYGASEPRSQCLVPEQGASSTEHNDEKHVEFGKRIPYERYKAEEDADYCKKDRVENKPWNN